jgi:hypothetical protein
MADEAVNDGTEVSDAGDHVAPVQDAEVTDPVQDTTAEGDESALGDKGKRALDRMKAERREAQQREREAQQRVAELAARLEALERTNAGETVDVDALRAEAVAEATRVANERVLRAEVKAAAAGVLADPADALRFLDLSALPMSDDGTVDESAIRDAVAGLAADRPYLTAQSPKVRGDADAGPRNGAATAQLTRQDLARMTPQQVDEAFAAGRLSKVLTGG